VKSALKLRDGLGQGWGPIYYHGSHELCIITGEPKNQLILF